jgi:predicted HicB family RNase H-like nuclease
MMISSTINQEKTTSFFQPNTSTFEVCLSDAEAQVIRSKAKKAGISVNEYVRNAALGFPMS